MTELSKSKPDTQSARPALHEVNKRDFYIALFGAPLVVALVFFWVFFIPVLALGFGSIPWLIFGGPALWMTLRHRGPGPMLLVSTFLSNALCTPLAMFFSSWVSTPAGEFLNDLESAIFLAAFTTAFGCVFSLIWAAAFWWIFHLLTKRRTAKQDETEANPPQAPAQQ